MIKQPEIKTIDDFAKEVGYGQWVILRRPNDKMTGVDIYVRLDEVIEKTQFSVTVKGKQVQISTETGMLKDYHPDYGICQVFNINLKRGKVYVEFVTELDVVTAFNNAQKLKFEKTFGFY